jgi:prepilin-type processing-associated H-X9-DG protein
VCTGTDDTNGAVSQNANNHRGHPIAAFTDGTSGTLLAGDKRLDLLNLGQWQTDDNEGYSAGFDHDTVRTASVPPLPDTRIGWYGEYRFGSSHLTGFNALMCDGSVRFITYSISQSTFAALGTRNGDDIPGPDF